MGAPINPQMIAALLKSKMAGGGPPAATGAPGDDSTGPAARALQSSNPDYGLQLVQKVKKDIVGLIPTFAESAPGAARALASCLKGLDSAIKELQQAMATSDAVGGPIKNSAIPTPQPPGSATPSLPNPANQAM